MKLSNLLGRTLRDAPAEADQIGHQLALRAGLVRAMAPGSFALLPLGMAAARRIEAHMHAELARIGAQELRTPVVQQASLWEQSGRYAQYGPQMLKLADRSERALVVAPTHEEAIAELARREISSYRQLPALVYQIHTKYRDEIRTKGGLMRMREFTMLDAYSLDADDAGLDAVYDLVAGAFERVFAACGVRFVAVEASAGEMGGREPREYMALSAAGEDTLAICENCGYAANVEVAIANHAKTEIANRAKTASANRANAKSANDAKTAGGESLTPDTQPPAPDTQPPAPDTQSPAPATLVETPGAATIAELAAFLGITEAETAKAVFFDTPERGLVFAVIRGDLEVSEPKLMAAARVSELRPATAEQIAASGAVPGYASPVGLEGLFVVADESVLAAGPLVAGANRAGYHLRNVVASRDWQPSVVADISAVRAGDPCARCGSPLALEKGVEIGHIFKLGTRFTKALGASYLDERGAPRPVVMGSYGIGVERLLQVIIEQHHDERGITWPASVAPADVHIIALGKGEAPKLEASRIYAALLAAGLRPLLDDRDETAGVKFNDADLIGLPLRLVVGEKLLATGEVELKPRRGEVRRVPREGVVEAIRGLLG